MHRDVDGELEREPERVEQFAYFMICVHRSSLASSDCSPAGVVEQLATGEKMPYASSEELVRIVCRWSDTFRNIPINNEQHNEHQ
jgi:hypothetical protein